MFQKAIRRGQTNQHIEYKYDAGPIPSAINLFFAYGCYKIFAIFRVHIIVMGPLDNPHLNAIFPKFSGCQKNIDFWEFLKG